MRLIIILTILIISCSIGCGSEHGINVESSEHIAYVSVAETWREVCADRYNIYDYPNKIERQMLRSECRRKFANGEEVLDFPQLPGGAM